MSSLRTPSFFAEDAEAQVRLPRGFVVALADAQLDVSGLAHRAGLPVEPLSCAEPILTAPQLAALYEAMFAPPAPADLGLRIGAGLKPELFGVVGLAALSAATYGAAVERCARYKRMLTEMHVDLTTTGDEAVLRISVPGPPSPARDGRVDVELGFLVAFGRSLTDRSIALREVRLQRAATGDEAHERFFGCPVRFGADDCALILDAASLEIPLLGADAEAHRALVDLAEHRLDEHGDSLLGRTRAAIEGMLVDGPPRLPAVARRLATSERTLQRALRHEGTSYNELLDRTRRDRAFALLRQRRWKIVEVAYLVGFSHLSSFYRAFERWAGTSPAAFLADG